MGEGRGEGQPLAQSGPDRALVYEFEQPSKHTSQIFVDFRIINSKNPKSLRTQILFASCVIRLFLIGAMCRAVISTIDDDHAVTTSEIGKVWSNRTLPDEFQSVEATIAQLRPNSIFSQRRPRAKHAGTVRAPWLLTTHVTSSKIEQVAAPHPNLLPAAAQAAEERGEGADRVSRSRVGSLAHLPARAGS